MDFKALLPMSALLLAMPVHAADTKCELKKYAELPITMSSGVPTVSGKVNGVETKFQIDSGAYFSFISREFAEQLQLPLRDDPTNARTLGVDKSPPSHATTVKEFSLVGYGAKPINNVDFIVMGSNYVRGVGGTIGQNIVGASDSEYDLANGFLRLFTTKGCGDRALSYWNTQAAEMKIQATAGLSSHFSGTAMLNGKPLKALFNSDYPYSFISLKAAKRAGFDPKAKTSTPIELYNSTGKIDAWISHFDSIAFGSEEIRNTQIRVVDFDYGNYADMLLGLDFFLSHRIYFAKDQKRVYFTYSGGPIFNLKSDTASKHASSQASIGTGASDATDAGMSAEAFRLRGAASLARNDMSAAMPDLNRAVQLDPNDAENFHQRSLAHRRQKDYDAAISDLDAAIKLSPQSATLLFDRAILHNYYKSNFAAADADFDAVINLSPKDGKINLRIARAHGAAKRHIDALRIYDQWAKDFPKASEMADVLNERCWMRITQTKEIDAALADCNASLKIERAGQTLDSRGMVWLVKGNYQEALKDYKAALKTSPKSPMTLYGLSIAEARTGNAREATNHRDAAIAIRATVADEFKRIGVEP